MKFWRDERGAALALAAISLPMVLGGVGLAMDTVQWTIWKRQLQQAADSSAIAGALAKANGNDVMRAANDILAKDVEIGFAGSPIIENAPTQGAFAGQNDAVRVVVRTQQRLPFSSFFLETPPVVEAQAVAKIIVTGEFCVLALENTALTGISLQGNATVNLGCGMATNSRSSAAISAGGSSFLNATTLTAVGGIPASGSYVPSTQLRPNSITQRDPFEHLPVPTVSGCKPEFSVKPNQTRSLAQGCYKGLDIQGTLNLQPGVYYIDGSTVSFGSQAVINGEGVTIVLTSADAVWNPASIATLDVNGGATLNLSAPTTGTYAGVLFAQDRRALDLGTNKLTGNSTSNLQGAVYFPRQELQFIGNADMGIKCIQMVGRRVSFTGNSSVTNECPANSGASSFKGTAVRIVY